MNWVHFGAFLSIVVHCIYSRDRISFSRSFASLSTFKLAAEACIFMVRCVHFGDALGLILGMQFVIAFAPGDVHIYGASCCILGTQ